MRLPRWTVYPALATLAVFAVGALPRPVEPEASGAALAARGAAPTPTPAPKHKRVVVLGIDGLDPEILQDVIARYPDRMRNFAALIEEGELASLGTSYPPQSPVAWSNFITGRNPGGHGIYDFIHRNPVTRTPVPGSVKEVHGSQVDLWGDWKFPIGGDTPSNRSGKSFWQILRDHGVPADVWRMPANFPVESSLGLSFPGMMTPALDSAYGTYTVYSTDPPVNTQRSGGRFQPVSVDRQGVIRTRLLGPPNSFKQHDPQASVPLTIYVDAERGGAVVEIGDQYVVLAPGEWSDFVQASFEMLPMGISSVSGIVRFYLRSLEPFELYCSPVNIDPTDPVAPVSEPTSASADLKDAIGWYYTQGMAEEVNALKDEAITEREFMHQSRLVYDQRVRMMEHALDLYLSDDEGGLFFFYYSTIDLCCHMMWHVGDEEHPHHPHVAALADESSTDWTHRDESQWRETIADLYMLMDPVLGRMRSRLAPDDLLIVMSDHGFAPWHRKFSLNTWLLEEGYLVLKEGRDKEQPGGPNVFAFTGDGSAVDWTRTRAYAMGFNGLYLNLAGRELDDPATPDVDESGIVEPGVEADALLAELKVKLEAIRDPKNGAQVVLSADLASAIYHGERIAEAPDILVGYNAGYGNSDASSTGRIPNAVLDDNDGGTFNGNHLMSPRVVAGTLITNGRVREGDHDLEDLTVEILKQYGIDPPSGMDGEPVLE
ncbi:MAG: alkaline phosphatase family protein [Planctomycetes bacterium]|nr:alkaline phosphatase family protein [Planctomycetota bacterium]